MPFCLYSNIPSSPYLSSPPNMRTSNGGVVTTGTNGVTPYSNQGLVVLPANSDFSCPVLGGVSNVGVSLDPTEYQTVMNGNPFALTVAEANAISSQMALVLATAWVFRVLIRHLRDLSTNEESS